MKQLTGNYYLVVVLWNWNCLFNWNGTRVTNRSHGKPAILTWPVQSSRNLKYRSFRHTKISKAQTGIFGRMDRAQYFSWVNLPTTNFGTVLTKNLWNPRDVAPLINLQKCIELDSGFHFLTFRVFYEMGFLFAPKWCFNHKLNYL